MNLGMVLSLPKSIYVNLKIFNLKTAIKLPVLISYKTKCRVEKGAKVFLDMDIIKPGIIKIAVGGSNTIPSQKSIVKLCQGSLMIIKGSVQISEGISLTVKGELQIGGNFYCNKNCTISCDKKIVFGENCLLGYDVELRDGDGHLMGKLDAGKEIWFDNTAEISIGENVWIASKTGLLKGAVVFDNSVVGYGSLVTKKIDGNEGCVLLAGRPAKVIKKNIIWKR